MKNIHKNTNICKLMTNRLKTYETYDNTYEKTNAYDNSETYETTCEKTSRKHMEQHV